jgi:glutamate/tyrosine decarboxylase-like PLP-dependent enzyme
MASEAGLIGRIQLYHPVNDLLREALSRLDEWRGQWPDDAHDPLIRENEAQWPAVLDELARRLTGNYPFHSPYYAGQMLKPPHPVAWAAYALAASVNPNNHALDGGPPTSELEKDVIAELGRLFGFGSSLGHLTSSGTIANLEALWVASKCHPGKRIVCSREAHYTHARMCEVLGIPYHVVDDIRDAVGIPDAGTIVVTMGTTGMGHVEPLADILPVARANGIRIHVDAAYGGFFKLLGGPHWDATGDADSLVVDPHKHGLQPYGCGCVLFRDPAVGRFYKHDSPYTYFTSDDLHLGEISLECSRAGAAAAALWATMKAVPFEKDRGLGPILQACRDAAVIFAEAVTRTGAYAMVEEPALDIVVYHPTGRFSGVSEISRASEEVFRRGMADGPDGVFVSLYRMPSAELAVRNGLVADAPTVTVLRSVLMKPSHRAYAERIAERLVRYRM